MAGVTTHVYSRTTWAWRIVRWFFASRRSSSSARAFSAFRLISFTATWCCVLTEVRQLHLAERALAEHLLLEAVVGEVDRAAVLG